MNTPKITAQIKIEQGLPRMYIDGKFTSPLMFLGNTEAEGWHNTLANEIKIAASKGVHLHSFVVHMPVIEEGVTPDFSHLHVSFDYVLEADPEALLFPRMFLPFKPLDFWHNEAKDDTITYSDGRLASPSPASQRWIDSVSKSLAATIDYILSIPKYSQRVVGYHLTPTYFGEWFFEYKSNGIDVCKANQQAYAKYIGKDEPLPTFDNFALWNENDKVFYDKDNIAKKIGYQDYLNNMISR